ncbi:MAG: 50S ribosomal protein L6 [Spirochaetota bacterium]|nr:50S ribosomal protein L6 [Spirochaetota bacterium]
MSRVGKKPIEIPNGVMIRIDGGVINVEGPLGKQNQYLFEGIEIKIEDKILQVINVGCESDRNQRALHGLSRSLIANMITGVSKGFERDLEIVGVGYRATQQNQDVVFQLGFSHNVQFSPPDGTTVEVIEPTLIKVKGVSKQQVGQVAADIRRLRPPEPYKGKGIRYRGEYVRRKAGKAGKK